MDDDVDESIVAKLGEQFQLTAKKSELLDEALESNARKAKDVAEEVQRYNVALDKIIENYATWQEALQSNSTADKLAVMPEIKDALADTLGISENVISNSFATTTKNLEDMRLALEGDKLAYERLQ
jgi:response regulator RpfG family c-di-GMP phosphodiesterase